MSDKQADQTTIFGDILAPFQPATEIFADYPIVLTLLILVLAFIVARISATIVVKIIGRMAKRTHVRWDDQVIAAFHKPLFWSLVFFGVLLSLEPLALPSTAENIFQSIIATTLIIIWTSFLLRFIRIVLRAMSRSARENSMVRPQTRPLFENLGFIIALAVSVYLIFRSWDVDMTAWLASAGVVGIAVGFAAKDTLANLFSGVFILADAPYKIDDYIVLDSGERGKVTHIGIRSTRLLTRGDVEITIPNSIMGNTRVINESGGPHEKYRIQVSVGVAYGSDIDQVKDVLMEIAVKEPQVCDVPEPRIRFRTFGASSLDLDLLCWTETPEERGRVLDILNTAIYKRFNEDGIEIPYSKQDVYIKEMPGR
jgi:small-conductance mechanosensitive channel